MEQQGRRAIGRVCPRGAESYTWQEGDTAERIARTYATTVQALQVINPGVDFATLTAGEEICLPNFIYTCISGQPYVVEDGDTFASIAARLGITTFELAERNPGVSQNNLTVGQVLSVRQDIRCPRCSRGRVTRICWCSTTSAIGRCAARIRN